MPELPEVETVCRGLDRVITGGKVDAIITRRKNLRTPFPKNLSDASDAKITGIRRRAKYILIDLSNKTTLVIHLGMSGRMVIYGRGEKHTYQKHDHMIIRMKDGTEVVLNDARRFGVVDLVPTGNLGAHKLFKHLGYEPLEKSFTAKNLTAALAGRKTAIKIAIMDQRIVVGVGNIYASEALYLAGIHPARVAGSVAATEIAKLVPAIIKVLQKAIKAGGSSLRDYVQTDGELGYFQHQFSVYDRAGENCRVCGDIIEKTVQGGRSSFYCPTCQKKVKIKP